VLNVSKKGASYLVGHVTYEVYRPAVNLPLNLNTQSKKFATNAGIAQSEITLDELVFRYNANAIGGNLEVKNSGATSSIIIWTGTKKQGAIVGATAGTPVLNGVTGAFTPLLNGNLGVNEFQTYEITSASANQYLVKLANFGTTMSSIYVQKLTA
jgi:hypothetical protein